MSPFKRILRHTAATKPLCPICNEPVTLESSKTDEDGRAIHEECYIAKICPEQSSQEPKSH